MESKWTHIPVLAGEIKDLLITNPSGIYIDGTLGLGGHTRYLLNYLNESAKIIGLDLDDNAVVMARENVADARLIALNFSYTQAKEVIDDLGLGPVDGILLDLGLSSYQLDDGSRGFSFNNQGPLDMRFNPRADLTAAEVVNSYPVEELERIFKEYGEEPFAEKIATAIVLKRKEGRIATTHELSEIVKTVVKARGKIHPATRVFQAIRIEVNSELKNVERLPNILKGVLKPGGRAAVITFHSLEDRIVKNAFKNMAAGGEWRLVNKKVIAPSYQETRHNFRSRSAKLRVIEKTAAEK
ncbi:16S rRNA (cytosine1402-N4)-methyltransferase [Parelusimicrobium proximum]|uniref:16S rRNA (cytosine(1402)-N(4))-methyltransferase RsmH n=1 Tax=Parelusimicrobium proximum TaxID=3228953 RepID=UPI003D164578